VQPISVLNDVLGPVMRGPSSSHTAGAYRIATIARALFGAPPVAAGFTFDPEGSYAPTYLASGVDRALACGLLGLDMLDERFHQALDLAREQGLDLSFAVAPLADADHPNTVAIELTSADGARLALQAKSTGGGGIAFTRVGSWSVHLDGKLHAVLVECDPAAAEQAARLLGADGDAARAPEGLQEGQAALCWAERYEALGPDAERQLGRLPGVRAVRQAPPVFLVPRGTALFADAERMVALAEANGESLGQVVVRYEAELLRLAPAAVLAEMVRRYGIMRASVDHGLQERDLRLRMVQPCAQQILEAERAGRLAVGGPHTRAAARALAVMHVDNSMGVVCAAPTGGSAGVLPGVLVTLAAERGLTDDQVALALFAASGVGLVIAHRATFAAEIAGCQVEIAAAGAMAAAAVVEVAGGTPQQAADAAAIALQNNVGLVCDPVGGGCEVPCHTRNAAAAASAFVCADLVLGGYANPIPLDETVDAVYAVGQMLPRELRCTALGGLAVTPSGCALAQREQDS